MKFSSKMSNFLMGGAVGFTMVLTGLSTEIAPFFSTTATAQLAQTLSPEEVNLRAKQIIVRIDGASVGSGSLIKSTDNVYTVLTNWHVMKNQGEYTVSTIDGRKHQVQPNSIKQLPGLDLAVLQFTSNQNYQVAELGDSANLSEGQSVYFAGYPGELREEDNRYYRFFAANLVGILPKPTENGYSLIYNGEAFPGMSGGPVFNQNGLVIGVHGEANVNAVSGGTSNYAIPINTYQTAIANLNQQPSPETTPAKPPANNTNNVTTQPETPPQAVPQTNKSPKVAAPNSNNNSDHVSSVPTFVREPQSETPPQAVSNGNQPELMDNSVVASEAETKASNHQNSQPTATSPTPEVAEVPVETIEVNTTTRKIALVSQKTGIDYTALRDLLQAEKWSEADIATYKLVEQIVKTAKERNKNIFIELKTIAEFSCPDIRTIDYLWKKYTGDKFGFSSQQEVWQSVNQQGDFSTQTWRRFATEVGWKKGKVDSGSGYLLYDQLDFDPNQAPTGHLPWWFALPDEEQNVIKHLFARCNFNPSPQELAAEEGKDRPKNPRDDHANQQEEKTPEQLKVEEKL